MEEEKVGDNIKSDLIENEDRERFTFFCAEIDKRIKIIKDNEDNKDSVEEYYENGDYKGLLEVIIKELDSLKESAMVFHDRIEDIEQNNGVTEPVEEYKPKPHPTSRRIGSKTYY